VNGITSVKVPVNRNITDPN